MAPGEHAGGGCQADADVNVYLCKFEFGVPEGAKLVKCPRCQTINPTSAAPAQLRRGNTGAFGLGSVEARAGECEAGAADAGGAADVSDADAGRSAGTWRGAARVWSQFELENSEAERVVCPSSVAAGSQFE